MPLIGKRVQPKNEYSELTTQTGAQKLIQPLNNMIVGFGYKNTYYPTIFHNFTHYGADYWGDRTVFASGNGIVLNAGRCSTFGNSVVVRYDNVFIHKTGETRDLIARYYHLSSIKCYIGQRVTKDTILGITGSTGKFSTGIHLHMEFSVDVNDPFGVPGIYNTNMFHWAKDKTIDPAYILYTKPDAPDKQRFSSAGGIYKKGGKIEDWTLPKT